MNERIKELYEQAHVTLTTPMLKEQYQLFSAEKFAELIVKECAVELMKLGNSYSDCDADADYMQGMLDSADIIKEHFGVE